MTEVTEREHMLFIFSQKVRNLLFTTLYLCLYLSAVLILEVWSEDSNLTLWHISFWCHYSVDLIKNTALFVPI